MEQKTDTRAVRKGEELNLTSLEKFIRDKMNVPAGPMQVRQFGAGHSNLTYELQVKKWNVVLRRPPLGPLPPKAHDMEREYKVLKAIHPVFPLVPEPLLFNDGDILGVPFFIMERRKGIVYDTEFPVSTVNEKDLGERISEEMVERLVELHAINYKETPLTHLVHPDGFMERQIHGWIERFNRARTDDVVAGERLMKWLLEHIPASDEATIIHYDYKLNNAMFDADHPSQMTGLFDWEMTTVGDPLADVAAAMSYWIEEKDPEILKTGLGKPPLTVKEGFLTREQFLNLYAEKSGRDLSRIHIYLTFAYFKLAVIVQQIYARYKNGQTNDPRFADMNLFVTNLIQHAEETAGL